jgi:kynurenine formamidase
MTAEDFEYLASDIPPNSALLINTGSDTTKYLSRDAARWMAKRKVALFGSNTGRYDTGFVNPTGFFIDLFKAEIPIIANITNLHFLPCTGFTLVALLTGVKHISRLVRMIVADHHIIDILKWLMNK